MTKPASTSPQAAVAPQLPVVVGVDGSAKNSSAVAWAAAEAERAHHPLQLLMVADKQDREPPPYAVNPLPPGPVDRAYGIVDGRATQIRRSHPGVTVTTDVLIDDPRRGLVAAAKHAHMIVVGKRGLGRFKRVMLGSTSIELAGRSTAPVVVVPSSWRPEDDAGRSILVGIDTDRDCTALLEFAFQRAAELEAPLVVLHVWDSHPSTALLPEERDAWSQKVEETVAKVIGPCTRKYPDVEARPAQSQGHAAQGLLDAAEHAQLLILGRHAEPHPHLGLGIGSIARTVMHYAQLPVAVVPSS